MKKRATLLMVVCVLLIGALCMPLNALTLHNENNDDLAGSSAVVPSEPVAASAAKDGHVHILAFKRIPGAPKVEAIHRKYCIECKYFVDEDCTSEQGYCKNCKHMH